jgi:hypothetical protein
LARSNYKFNKRQKEIARQKKKEEKRQRRQEKNETRAGDTPTEENLDRVAQEKAQPLPAGPDQDNPGDL